MSAKYLELAIAESVRNEQQRYYGRSHLSSQQLENDQLSEEEIEFVRSRDSFYMATISETGWPYVQHRGGETGFLHVVNPQLLAFADYRGNRQLLSTGNLMVNKRVALFLMDYSSRNRLKIMGEARVEDARTQQGMVQRLVPADKLKIVERVFLIDVMAYDWNCSQHITPRYTTNEIQKLMEPLQRRVAELEAELRQKQSA